MSFHFDTIRIIQCVGYLLKKEETKQLNYTKMIKLLYLADRKSLEETGSPITGDRAVAMERGPVLSNTLDFIKNEADEEEQAVWSRFIETKGYDVALLLDPGEGRLSPYQTKLLDSIFSEHKDKSQWQLVDLTHTLQEWEESYVEGTSTPIGLNATLKALGQEERYDELSQQKVEDAHFAKLFGD